MTKLAVFTSGGDAPGMNAAVRAVVRTAITRGMEVIGVRKGFQGLVCGNFVPMDSRSVSNILQLGGTILYTSRCPEFKLKETRAGAIELLKKEEIDFLVPIGGNGTMCGVAALCRESDFRIVQVPSTIDNDVYGTDFTIGFDTAVSTAVEAIDRIRDSAFSMERLFFVEVMGRDAGFVALQAGIAGGAEVILVPETPTVLGDICHTVQEAFKRGKRSFIVVVAEGDAPGGAFKVAREIRDMTGIESKVCVLGHMQRGGSPTARDRVLATRLGVAAVEALLEGASGVMVGEVGGKIVRSPLEESISSRKPLDDGLLKMIQIVSGEAAA